MTADGWRTGSRAGTRKRRGVALLGLGVIGVGGVGRGEEDGEPRRRGRKGLPASPSYLSRGTCSAFAKRAAAGERLTSTTADHAVMPS